MKSNVNFSGVIIIINDKLIELTSYGRLLVVTDLHGNYEDYKSYLKLWDCDDEDFHIVFVGDLIHSPYPNDKSIEILDDAISKTKKYSNFHVLLGNHEWAHITDINIYKFNKNLKESFEKLIREKKGSIHPTLDNYIEFFKSLPFFLKTDNGLFISHAGPSKNIESYDDFEKIFDNDYDNKLLYDFLWNRFDDSKDYDEGDVSRFLRIVGSKCMIVGHNDVAGYKIFGKQVIIASSFLTDTKTYFDIDLRKQINNVPDLMDYIKFL